MAEARDRLLACQTIVSGQHIVLARTLLAFCLDPLYVHVERTKYLDPEEVEEFFCVLGLIPTVEIAFLFFYLSRLNDDKRFLAKFHPRDHGKHEPWKPSKGSRIHISVSVSPLRHTGPLRLCGEPACLRAAADIVSKRNATLNPCTHFWKYGKLFFIH